MPSHWRGIAGKTTRKAEKGERNSLNGLLEAYDDEKMAENRPTTDFMHLIPRFAVAWAVFCGVMGVFLLGMSGILAFLFAKWMWMHT